MGAAPPRRASLRHAGSLYQPDPTTRVRARAGGHHPHDGRRQRTFAVLPADRGPPRTHPGRHDARVRGLYVHPLGCAAVPRLSLRPHRPPTGRDGRFAPARREPGYVLVGRESDDAAHRQGAARTRRRHPHPHALGDDDRLRTADAAERRSTVEHDRADARPRYRCAERRDPPRLHHQPGGCRLRNPRRRVRPSGRDRLEHARACLQSLRTTK